MSRSTFFILIGGMVSFILSRGSILAVFAGAVIGNMLEKQLYKSQKVKSSIFPQPLTRQALFLQTTFAVLGHVSKIKGRVTETDILLAKKLMRKYNLHGKDQQKAIEAFNLGKNSDFRLRIATRELRAVCDVNLLKIFINIQLQAVFSDNIVTQKEKNVLFIIAEEVGISRYQLEQMIMFDELSQYFSNGWYQNQEYTKHHQYSYNYGNQQTNQNQSNRQYSHYNNYKTSDSYITEAYKVLRVTSADDKNTVKRAYRKLMNEYHPDKLVAKGLPPEMMDEAKEKAQRIQAAYDLICKTKNWK